MQQELNRVRLYRDINGEKVRGNMGIIKGDTFITNRLSRTHFFRKQAGYPFSVSLINHLKKEGVKKIRIVEHREVEGTSKIYECYVHDFDNVIPFQEKGNDLQVCIPLRRWQKFD